MAAVNLFSGEAFERSSLTSSAQGKEYLRSLAAARGRGVVLNVLSALSWHGMADVYSATKAALWSATNTQRVVLAAEGIHVASLHLGYADTPMSAGTSAPKLDPAEVVRAAYDGIERGDFEVLVDDLSRNLKAGLAGPIEALYPQLRKADR